MIEVGTLVRYKADGDIGIVTDIFMDHGSIEYCVRWSDGTHCNHIAIELEVIS